MSRGIRETGNYCSENLCDFGKMKLSMDLVKCGEQVLVCDQK